LGLGLNSKDLSGGQKQRVNIARALYFDADIVLFDDPMSAVDAHVGRALFQVRLIFTCRQHSRLMGHQNAIVDGLRGQGKTVVLVTHALHFLSDVDYIYTIQDGAIVQQGNFTELMASNGPFATLMRDFGGVTEEKEEDEEDAEEEAIEEVAQAGRPAMKRKMTKEEKEARKALGTGKEEGKLIVKEQRDVGSIKSSGTSSPHPHDGGADIL
jgi:ATP-binding cassette subfamily C (CFTR/MRP) protein 1